MFKKLLSILLLLIFFLTGCAQKTVFFTDPPGAQVKINGEEVCETPCDFQYHTGTGKSYEVCIEKEGFETINQVITADEVDEKNRLKWIAAGVVWSPLWLGTFFTKKLKDSYNFILSQVKDRILVGEEKQEYEKLLVSRLSIRELYN